MSIFKLNKRTIDNLRSKIGSLFDIVKIKLLGPRVSSSKSLFVTFDHSKSIPGLYEAASREGGLPNLQELETIIDTSKNYIDALELKTANKVIKELEHHLQSKDSTPESIEKVLQEAWKDVTKQLGDIVAAESQTAQNIGLLNGIIRQNSAFKIDDPVIFWVCPYDADTCPDCKRLHFMPGGSAPRLWYLREIKHSYGKHGDKVPSVHNQHPHCRGYMVTLLPGYGFSAKGRVTYIGKGHSEIEKQRG